MALQSSYRFGSLKTLRETTHTPKTLGHRGSKLLDDAQRVAKATSGQNLGRLLPRRADSQDISIQRLQTQLAKMAQILIDNRTMKLAQVAGAGQSEVRIKEPTLTPWEGQNRRQRRTKLA